MSINQLTMFKLWCDFDEDATKKPIVVLELNDPAPEPPYENLFPEEDN